MYKLKEARNCTNGEGAERKFKEIYGTQQQTRQKVRAERLQIQNVNLAEIQSVNTAQIRGFNVTAVSPSSEGCLHFDKKIENFTFHEFLSYLAVR